MRALFILTLLMSCLLILGCEAEEDQCVDGKVEACPCSDGSQSTQTCSDGSWTSCACGQAPDLASQPDLTPDADTAPDEDLTTEFGEDTSDISQVDVGTHRLDYRFVRIDDLSEATDTPQGGADIDAVVLQKYNGDMHYADNVEAFVFGAGTSDTLDPIESLGAPDAFYNYSSGDSSVCNITGGQGTSGRPFVSLGGEGGILVVRMSGVIEGGDFLTVLEVGNCEFNDGEGTAIAEELKVLVSVSNNIDMAQWELLGQGEGPEITFSIPSLPPVYVDP